MNLQEDIQRIRQMMISEEMVQSDAWKSIKKTLDILKICNYKNLNFFGLRIVISISETI